MENRRTRGMIVIAVLNLILGSWQTLGSIVGVLFSQAMLSKTMDDRMTGMALLMMVATLANLPIGVIGIASGIGVFLVRSWGRVATFAYAGGWVLVSVLTLIIGFAAASISGDSAGSAFSIIGYILQAIFYPAILVYLMLKPTWRSAFKGEKESSVSEFRAEPSHVEK